MSLFRLIASKHKKQIGDAAEQAAKKFLEARGYRARATNFTCKYGEIDLIMESPQHELVFVEVRYRNNHAFGGGVASVTAKKQKNLRNTAAYYLQQQKINDSPCRFDIISISGFPDAKGTMNNIEWIEAAF